FVSREGETYRDSSAHDVVVRDDRAPTVKITKPGKNIELPANGLLKLEGKATDDHGLARITLRMQVVDGPGLLSKPYLQDLLGKQSYGYPRSLEYKDFVDLAALKDENGKPYTPKVGQEIQYWLEVADACDYPRANVTESKRYKVTIIDPVGDKKKR